MEYQEGFGPRCSPFVRRLARESGVDLKKVQGTGPEGRILKKDLEGHIREQGDKAPAADE